jgi:hypothetical protein
MKLEDYEFVVCGRDSDGNAIQMVYEIIDEKIHL